MEFITFVFVNVTNSLPDSVRFAIFPLLRLIAHSLGLRIFEDGSI